MGSVTAAIVCAEGSALAGEVDFPIAVPVGPEVVTGSTRMKAGTATKLVLNMISTGLMIRLGYTFGNLMVNVQPKNEKLVDRARRIVAEAGAVDAARAAELFEAGGRSVKVAIVMARLGTDREQAMALLEEKRGVLAEVLRG
jgi:N-acetylmuramic acid 6-phosphate etherase